MAIEKRRGRKLVHRAAPPWSAVRPPRLRGWCSARHTSNPARQQAPCVVAACPLQCSPSLGRCTGRMGRLTRCSRVSRDMAVAYVCCIALRCVHTLTRPRPHSPVESLPPLAPPGPGHVLLRMLAAPVNPSDLNQIEARQLRLRQRPTHCDTHLPTGQVPYPAGAAGGGWQRRRGGGAGGRHRRQLVSWSECPSALPPSLRD